MFESLAVVKSRYRPLSTLCRVYPPATEVSLQSWRDSGKEPFNVSRLSETVPTTLSVLPEPVW